MHFMGQCRCTLLFLQLVVVSATDDEFADSHALLQTKSARNGKFDGGLVTTAKYDYAAYDYDYSYGYYDTIGGMDGLITYIDADMCAPYDELSGPSGSCPRARSWCNTVLADVAECWDYWAGKPSCNNTICNVDQAMESLNTPLGQLCKAYVGEKLACPKMREVSEAMARGDMSLFHLLGSCDVFKLWCGNWPAQFVHAVRDGCDTENFCDHFENISYHDGLFAGLPGGCEALDAAAPPARDSSEDHETNATLPSDHPASSSALALRQRAAPAEVAPAMMQLASSDDVVDQQLDTGLLAKCAEPC